MPNNFRIVNGVLQNYDGTDAHVVIPDGMTEIGVFAFSRCDSMTSVSIPNSVTEIGHQAFCTSKLTSVSIPESVKTIDAMAFAACSDLTSIILPASVTEIKNNAFVRCPKLTVFCPPDSYARQYCKDHKIPVKASE